MNCIKCHSKACKVEGKDCIGNRNSTLKEYQSTNNHQLYSNADQLVADGRAGTLSRVEELIEFIKLQNYQSVALAYCYALENIAVHLSFLLSKKKIKVESMRCTLGGIREEEILKNEKSSVNCNPIGQAQALNESQVDFVIEIGLCLGHDVLFHQYLKKPFTVLIVKDRLHNHNPIQFFS